MADDPLNILEQIRALHIRFQETHVEGMVALERMDLPANDAAIAKEREIIDERVRLIEAYRKSRE